MSRTLFVGAIFALVAASVALALSANAQRYDVEFHLRRINSEAIIEDEFNARNVPGHNPALFRKFLDNAQLKDLLKSSEVIISKVRSFLVNEVGCESLTLSDTNDMFTCKISNADEASKFTVGRKMHEQIGQAFRADPQFKEGQFRVSVLDIDSLSAVRRFLRGAVAYRFSPIARKDKKDVTFPGTLQTPASINRRYQVPSTRQVSEATLNVGVAEFEDSFFLQSDIDTFTANNHLNHQTIHVMGPNKQAGGAGPVEGTLDLEYMSSIGNASYQMWWLSQNTNHSGPGEISFHDLINKVLAMNPKIYVLSVSWGYGFQRLAFHPTVVPLDNDAFRKAGLSGLSLFAASGDSGPGTRSGIFDCTKFVPSWPAASPYITSVGATYANGEADPESAVDFSGGGFNTLNGAPNWQKEAIHTYLTTAAGLPKASFYNASGAAYPHVSALGTNFEVVVQGRTEPVSGTSCASPTFAGMISLILAERQAAGKGALGFLSPTLFKLGKVGFDVTTGASVFKNCLPFIDMKGFPAARGWDPVSGLGTPRYPYLREQLMKDTY